jgi:dihydroxyacetone kinase DhaKLM complex PTS-EIIA-like component DhaM
MGEGQTIDQQINESVDLVDEQLFTSNKKLILADEIDLARRNKQNAQGNDQKYADFGLRVAEDNHAFVQRMVNNQAAADDRRATNAATVDHLISMGNASSNMAMVADVAEKSAEVATSAVNAAIAQGATTSAPAQGVTGVAQGGLQTSQSVASSAIMGGIASNLNELSRLVAQNTKDIAQSNALMLQLLAELGKATSG